MTALPFVPKTIQFQLVYTDQADSDIRNMLYFTYGNSLSATDLQTLCNSMASNWDAHMATNTTTNVALEEVFASDLSSDVSAQAASTLGVQTGGNAGGHLTSGAAFVMGYETSRKYRGGHARNYLPGMPVTGLADANTWTAAWQTTIVNAWSAFLNAFVSAAVPVAVGALTHVVAHRFGKTPGAPVLASSGAVKSVPLAVPFTDPITAIRSNPQVGSQRRRNQQL